MTLTVTDDDGATGTVSHDVTVAAEPANQAPTAAFTSSSNFLVAGFVGSGSDVDGSIAGYDWDFGDSTAHGSGATPSHTYAAAGTYTVTLTVTDDDGATGTVSHDVTVQAQQVFAADAFGRTVTNGLGVADVGGSWTNSNPAANFAVGNGSASMNVATAGAAASGYLNTVSATNVDAVVDVSYDKAATGGGFYTSLITRRIGTSDYRVKLRVNPTSTQLYLARTVNGTETVLASGVGARDVRTGQRDSRPPADRRHRHDDPPGEGVVHQLDRAGGVDAHGDGYHGEPAKPWRGRYLYLRVWISDERSGEDLPRQPLGRCFVTRHHSGATVRRDSRRIWRVSALVGVALLGLSACGDDDDTESGGAAASTSIAAGSATAPPTAPGTGPRQPGAIGDETTATSTERIDRSSVTADNG